jgi:hypothetical protein
VDETLVLVEDVPEEDDVDADVGAANLDIFLIHPSAPAPTPSSTLSPHAAPFHPRGGTEGRSKARRWADKDLIDVSDVETMPTSSSPYLDALRSVPKPATSEIMPQSSSHGGAVPCRQGVGRRRGKRRRPRPQLVLGMAAQPVEGRILARQCLRRRRVFAPDADGWREILRQQATRPATASPVPPGPARGGRPASRRPPRQIPAELHGKCLNCLSSMHRVATCKLPQRCLRCKGLRHVVCDSKQPRRVGFRSSGVCASGLSNGPADLGGSCGLGGATTDTTDLGGTTTNTTAPATVGRRQRRRRRRRGPSTQSTRTAPASASDGGQVGRGEPIDKLATVELDPLALTTRLDATVCGLAEDPMLMELAASLKGVQTVLRPPLVSQPEDEVPVVATGVCMQCQQLLRAPSVSPQFEQSRATKAVGV